MEMLDIVDENGVPTGVVKERTQVHADGDLHRTSHVWIVRRRADGGMDVLLQKRSDHKDSNPGCYDISSAGHIPAGADYEESAVRELKEELGIDATVGELVQCWVRRVSNRNVFYDRPFIDNQVTRVYRLTMNNLDITSLHLQQEEVSEVIWMDYQKCLEGVRCNSFKNCICAEELEKIDYV